MKRVIIVVTLLMIGTIGARLLLNEGRIMSKVSEQPSTGVRFHDQNSGILLTLPTAFKFGELSDDDKKAKVLMRASSDNKRGLVLLRIESGLRLPASASKLDVLTMLLSNSDRMLPQRYPQYEKVKENKEVIRGVESAEIIFDYKSPLGEIVRQRFVIIELDGDNAAYLSMQSKRADFAAENRDSFDKIINSFKIEK